MATPPNPVEVPKVICEYLFYLPSSKRPRPPTRRKAQWLLSGSYTSGTMIHQLWPNKSGYDSVPYSSK
jgi:hypothetical protein